LPVNILEVNQLTKSFGGLLALSNVSISVRKGQLMGIIGPNGAGKTTIFNCITGFMPIDSGVILFEGMDISGKKPHEIVNLGLARSWQLIKAFFGMRVIEAMMLPFFSK